jgi:hypothetical protein
VRIARSEVHQAHTAQFLFRAGLCFVCLPSLQLERQRCIAQHVAPGDQRRFLKNKTTGNRFLTCFDREPTFICSIKAGGEAQ